MSRIELPICRWRREAIGIGRHACVSPKIVTGPRGVDDAKCEGCFARDHPPPRTPRGLCAHLGRIIDRRPCLPCMERSGRYLEIPVHACNVHGDCTVEIQAGALHCCRSCSDHQSRGPLTTAGSVRHLTYFVYPFGDVWRWNIAQLRERMSLFNGERVIVCARAPDVASWHEVAEALATPGVEFISVPNCPTLREMAGYPLLMERMSRWTSEADVTFYGHAKGVTSEQWAPSVRRWTTCMYSALLDFFPAVQRELRSHPAVGIFKRHKGTLPESTVTWHYSGSFRWQRNRDVYARNWKSWDVNWCGGEGHLAHLFSEHEVACLYGDYGRGGLGLYLPETWADWAASAAETWEREHANDLHTPLTVTVILTAHAQPDRVHEAIESVRQQSTDAWQLVIMDSGRIHATGAYQRYRDDARIQVHLTGETDELRARVGIQSWAINEVMRRELVRGDLVVHLSDDDVYDPDYLARVLSAAASHPSQDAWYMGCVRSQIGADGRERPVDTLPTRGVGQKGNPLDCKIDGMQVACRRSAWCEWPQRLDLAPHADGVWIDTLSLCHPIVPLPGICGRHRITPQSTFTRRMI